MNVFKFQFDLRVKCIVFTIFVLFNDLIVKVCAYAGFFRLLFCFFFLLLIAFEIIVVQICERKSKMKSTHLFTNSHLIHTHTQCATFSFIYLMSPSNILIKKTAVFNFNDHFELFLLCD